MLSMIRQIIAEAASLWLGGACELPWLRGHVAIETTATPMAMPLILKYWVTVEVDQRLGSTAIIVDHSSTLGFSHTKGILYFLQLLVQERNSIELYPQAWITVVSALLPW